eukprot:8286122-Pyramimonas_sp.AAC.1
MMRDGQMRRAGQRRDCCRPDWGLGHKTVKDKLECKDARHFDGMCAAWLGASRQGREDPCLIFQ